MTQLKLHPNLRGRLKELGVTSVEACVLHLLGKFFKLKNFILLDITIKDKQLLFENKLIGKRYTSGEVSEVVLIPLFSYQEDMFTKDQFEALRELWRGLFRNSMGNYDNAYKKLLQWFQMHPEYTIDDVEEACRLYIEDKAANGPDGEKHKFTRQFNYFILKDTEKGIVSDLHDYIEKTQSIKSYEDAWNEETI